MQSFFSGAFAVFAAKLHGFVGIRDEFGVFFSLPIFRSKYILGWVFMKVVGWNKISQYIYIYKFLDFLGAKKVVQDFVHQLKGWKQSQRSWCLYMRTWIYPSQDADGTVGIPGRRKNMSTDMSQNAPVFFHSNRGVTATIQAMVESFCKACCNYWMLFICCLFHGFYQFKLIKTK